MKEYYLNYELDDLFNQYDRIVCFDFETTGFSPVTDEIIEMAAITLMKDDIGIYKSDELNILVKLSKKSFLPPKIIEITNITDDMLINQGIDRDIANIELVKRFSFPKTLVVAHNAPFDLGFLGAVFNDLSIIDLMESFDCLDTLTVFRDRVKEHHRLCDAVTYYGLDKLVQNTHRGIDDVNCLIYLLFVLTEQKNDLIRYVNLIGYKPEFKPRPCSHKRLIYVPQTPGNDVKLYDNMLAVNSKFHIA